MRRRPTNTGSRGGFTLVELLLVISIIAIVLALTLVAIQSLQNQARATACLSNQRQLALANQSYATDNSGRLASPRTESESVIYDVPQTFPNAWVDTINTLCSGNRETDLSLERGALWSYLGESAKAYVSPQDPTARRDWTRTSPPTNCPDGRVRSYSFNGFVGVRASNPLGRANENWAFPDPNSSDYPDQFRGSLYKTVTMSQIPNPSRTMATITEEDSFGHNAHGWVVRVRPPTGVAGEWLDTPALWNPGRVNISYMDGSIEAPNIIYKELAKIMQPNLSLPPIHSAFELGTRPAHRFMSSIMMPGIVLPELQ